MSVIIIKTFIEKLVLMSVLAWHYPVSQHQQK